MVDHTHTKWPDEPKKPAPAPAKAVTQPTKPADPSKVDADTKQA